MKKIKKFMIEMTLDNVQTKKIGASTGNYINQIMIDLSKVVNSYETKNVVTYSEQRHYGLRKVIFFIDNVGDLAANMIARFSWNTFFAVDDDMAKELVHLRFMPLYEKENKRWENEQFRNIEVSNPDDKNFKSFDLNKEKGDKRLYTVVCHNGSDLVGVCNMSTSESESIYYAKKHLIAQLNWKKVSGDSSKSVWVDHEEYQVNDKIKEQNEKKLIYPSASIS